MLISGEHVNVGDEVLVRLWDDHDARKFGSKWRSGIVVALGVDVLTSAPLLELDDTGPRIYAHDVWFLSVLTRAVPAPLSSSVFRG